MILILVSYLLLFTGLVGSGLAGYFDLKTTEIPDQIPLVMVVLGLLIRVGYSLFSGDWSFLIVPLVIFIGFLGFGFLLYYTGQWGGGDAKILGAMGLLMGALPKPFLHASIFPFWLDYFFNVFFVGAAYTVIYAIWIAMSNPKVTNKIYNDFKGSSKEIGIFVSVVFGFVMVFSFLTGLYQISLALWALTISLLFLFKFLKVVEDFGLKKRIKTKYLKEGDMLDENIPKLNLTGKIIRGLTKEEVKSIKMIKKTVCIKEGVRFGPVFCIALIVTLIWGNLIIYLML